MEAASVAEVEWVTAAREREATAMVGRSVTAVAVAVVAVVAMAAAVGWGRGAVETMKAATATAVVAAAVATGTAIVARATADLAVVEKAAVPALDHLGFGSRRSLGSGRSPAVREGYGSVTSGLIVR